MRYANAEAIEAHLAVDHGDWEDPDWSLLDEGVAPAPDLPLPTLRSWGPWLRDYAAMKSAPVGYAVGALLAAAAGCIGMARMIDGRPGWRLAPAFWILLVGPPSAHKSPVLSPITLILGDIERAEAAGFETVRRAYETKRQSAKEHAALWESKAKAAVKAGRLAPLKPAEADEPEKPEPPRLIVEMATIEAMAPVFRRNPRGLILARDELAGFVGNIGKYGGDGDAAFWLERYDGKGLSVLTVKHGHVQAASGLLSMVGGIQPERLQEVLLDRADDGFVARFVMIYPGPVPREWITPVADMDFLRRALDRLRNLPVEFQDDDSLIIAPTVLSLAADAEPLFATWWIENGAATDASSGFRAGILGKAGGVVLRLALTLEYLEWAAAGGAEPKVVSRASIAAAIALFEDYLLPSTCRAIGGAGRDNGAAAAAMLAKQIRQRGERTINAKDIYRNWRLPGLTTSAAVNGALDRLQTTGWVRKAGGRDGDSPGRQRGDWEVNPLLWEVKR